MNRVKANHINSKCNHLTSISNLDDVGSVGHVFPQIDESVSPLASRNCFLHKCFLLFSRFLAHILSIHNVEKDVAFRICFFQVKSISSLESSVPVCSSAAWACRCPRRRTRRHGITATRGARGTSATAASLSSSYACFVTGSIPEMIASPFASASAPPRSDPSLLRLTLSRARARGFIMITISRRRLIPLRLGL